jgi:hypothetical protein
VETEPTVLLPLLSLQPAAVVVVVALQVQQAAALAAAGQILWLLALELRAKVMRAELVRQARRAAAAAAQPPSALMLVAALEEMAARVYPIAIVALLKFMAPVAVGEPIKILEARALEPAEQMLVMRLLGRRVKMQLLILAAAAAAEAALL